MSEQHGFKRINFFKGFLTTEKDWNDAEQYHIDKRQLHAKHLHAPGVVAGVGGELRVMARARGDLAIEVQSGYAVDGAGRDLYLPEPVIKNLVPEDYKLPQTIYVVLRYYEELSDFIAYKENLEYKGHRRVLESCKVEFSQTEPDLTREVELARISLERGVSRLRDARDPLDPRVNEIDLRFVPRAGVAGSNLSPANKLKFQLMVRQLRKCAVEYARRGVGGAREVSAATAAALAQLFADQVSQGVAFQLIDLLLEAQGELVFDIDAHFNEIAQKREFAEYRRALEMLRGALGEGLRDSAGLSNLLTHQGRATEAAWTALGEKPIAPRVKEEAEKPKTITLEDWDAIKVMPNLKEVLEIAGQTWMQIDELDILAKESESKHGFAIKEAKDAYQKRDRLKYPDGTLVEDTGRGHVGGYAEFKVFNVIPGRPLVLLRRTDYVYSNYELEISVNGSPVATSSCSGSDRVNRWRNWPVIIPADAVTDTVLVVRQRPLVADRDVNMYKIWAYQPK